VAAHRYAEMVRWMAWPRSRNSRSSAQPGTQPHDGVQAIVTPAPDAEPPPGSGQNTGVGGTTHAVVRDGGAGASGPAAGGRRVGRRLRPIRYAHSAGAGAAQRQAPAGPPAAPLSPSPPPAAARAPDVAPPGVASAPEPGSSAVRATGMPVAGRIIPGTVLRDPEPAAGEPDDDGTAGLVYEAPSPAYGEPPGEPQVPVRNDGLEIFGGVATTEVPDDTAPARELKRQPAGPADPSAGPVWNEPIASPPVTSNEEAGRKASPFGRISRIRLGGGQPADDGEPRASVRDLPVDVQARFIKARIIIVLVIGVVSFIPLRNWALSITFMIIAWIVDVLRRQRTAVLYVNGGAHPGARKATSKQLRKMRRDGYLTLDARPIPNSPEVIDHLVIGPTGVYAIDSEKWDPKLPVRTWNGKKLYHGPQSQKERLEHAVWEAAQATEILSSALGFEVKVRPALAIYGPKIPWNIATIRNVDVFTGPALGKYLKARGRLRGGVARLTPEEVRKIHDAAVRVLPDLARSYTPVG
jgi:hypothetical protein